jgi:RND family efflux transporter MFP subunit
MTGDVHAKLETTLAFRIAGKITERHADVGDVVAAGALIARLDSRPLQDEVLVAESTVRSAAAALERAALERTRARALSTTGATPEASLDDAETSYTVAASTLKAARASLDLARDTLSFTELRAAHRGVVTTRSIEVGQVVQAGAPAFTIAGEGARDAAFRVDESTANQLSIGTHVSVSPVDRPAVHVEGVVREMAPAVDPRTESVPIKVALTGAPDGMALGTPVVGRVELSAPRSFEVPAAAIFSDESGKPAVWVVDPATMAVSVHRIAAAAYESERVVVREGLEDGELVVVHGGARLRPAEIVSLAPGSRS